MNSVGFCVIYQFKVKHGAEEMFQSGWSRVTEEVRDSRGGLGSRLHLSDDGWWIAYAQWPNRDAWERSQQMDLIDAEAAQMMAESIVDRKTPILLAPQIDYLEPNKETT